MNSTKHDDGPRYVITIGQHNKDYRECYKRNGFYVHVLNTNWQIAVDHESIVKVREV